MSWDLSMLLAAATHKHTHTHKHTLVNSHTHTLSLSHTHTHSLSLSLAHTHPLQHDCRSTDTLPIILDRATEWRRCIECLNLQFSFRKTATIYRALLQKMTYKDRTSYASSPPCRTIPVKNDRCVCAWTKRTHIGVCVCEQNAHVQWLYHIKPWSRMGCVCVYGHNTNTRNGSLT